MADLIDTANRITDLVDSHGEIADCKVEKCATCNLIKELRVELGGEEAKKVPLSKFIYVVYKDGKEISRLSSSRKVSELINVAQRTVLNMAEGKYAKNGYRVEKLIRELEENE